MSRRGRDCMVVGFTPIITNVVSSNFTWATQHYVKKFVSDLRQVRVPQVPPPLKVTATI